MRLLLVQHFHQTIHRSPWAENLPLCESVRFASERSRVRIPSGPPKTTPSGWFFFSSRQFWPCPPAEKRPAEKRSRQRRHHTGGILPPAEGVLKKQRGRTYMGSPPLINVYFTRVPEQQRFFAAAKQHRLFDQAHFFRYCFIISPRMGIQRAMSSSPVVEKFSRMAFLPLPSQQKN